MKLTNKDKGYLWFTVAFVAIIILLQFSNPATTSMTFKDWLKLGLLELCFQLGFHFWNKKDV